MYSRRNTGSVNMREEFLRHRMRLEKILDKTATYAITRNDMYGVSQLVLRVSGLSAAATITLPSAADFQDQKITVLLDDDSQYAVTINNSGATKIQELNLNEDSAEFVSDGTNVRQIGGSTLGVITYDQTITIGSGQDMPFAATTWHYLSDVYIREGVTLTADIANATYTLGTTENIVIVNQNSPGQLYLTGDKDTPSNVVIRVPASYAATVPADILHLDTGSTRKYVLVLSGCYNVKIDGLTFDCDTNVNQEVTAIWIVESTVITLGDGTADSLVINNAIESWSSGIVISRKSLVFIDGVKIAETNATYNESIGIEMRNDSYLVVGMLNIDGQTADNTATGALGFWLESGSSIVACGATGDVLTVDNKYAAFWQWGPHTYIRVVSSGTTTFTGCRFHWRTSQGHNFAYGDANITGTPGSATWRSNTVGTWSSSHNLVDT